MAITVARNLPEKNFKNKVDSLETFPVTFSRQRRVVHELRQAEFRER
jgi:hypothetical protein